MEETIIRRVDKIVIVGFVYTLQGIEGVAQVPTTNHAKHIWHTPIITVDKAKPCAKRAKKAINTPDNAIIAPNNLTSSPIQ